MKQEKSTIKQTNKKKTKQNQKKQIIEMKRERKYTRFSQSGARCDTLRSLPWCS